jgi:phosphoribosylformimino-5-aminoimidazole carboxamide ribotide isomerase
VARALAEHFAPRTIYIADLDAILGSPPHYAAYQQVAATGVKLWLDAGIGDLAMAEQLGRGLGRAGLEAELVVGLESLATSSSLEEVIAARTPQNVIFSLDLQAGRPLTRIAAWQALAPRAIAERAVAAGIQRLILLDLADVGSGRGASTLALCRELRAAHPQLELTLGGGVRGPADLQEFAAAGATAALVASALHDGRLTRADCLLVG